MEWTVIGDPHGTHKSLDRLQQLFQIVESEGRNSVWLGDLLDTKEVIRGKCLNAFFEYFKSSKLKHVIIVGNHDWFNLECKDHSLKTLSSLPNVTVIDKPMTNGDVWFIPYEHDPIKLREMISKCDKPVLFCHVDVKDFDYGNGQICENGLSLDELSTFKMVVSGHFHKFQNKSNLLYLGSPFTHSFGESDQTKYLGVFDTVSLGMKLFETPIAKHVTLEVNMENLPDRLELHKWFEANSKNFIRVILTGTSSQIAALPRTEFEKYNIKWVPRPIETSMNNIVIEEGVDNGQQFVKWAKDVRKLDQATIDLGLSILGAVSAK